MDELATTSFAPATTWRLFGRSALTVETPRLSVDVPIRRGTPTTVAKGRFGEDGKTCFEFGFWGLCK